MLIKQGTVIRKWSHNLLPDETDLKQPLEKCELGKMPEDSVPKKILSIVIWFILPLFVLTLADRLWAWSKWISKPADT